MSAETPAETFAETSAETPAETPAEPPENSVLGYGSMFDSDRITEPQVDAAYREMQAEISKIDPDYNQPSP